MRFTANVRRKLHVFFLAVFFVMYVGYLLFDRLDDDSKMGLQIVQNHAEAFPTKSSEVDALILGGSNATFGFSAELLSQLTPYRFYNLALIRNGFNPPEHIRFLMSITSKTDRDRIKRIVFSTVQVLRPLPFDDFTMRVDGYSKSFIEPSRSILGFIYDRLRAKQQFKVTGEYGDFDFTHFNCVFNSSNVTFSPPPVNVAVDYIKDYVDAYKIMFVNAQIIVVAPTEYDLHPSLRNSYVNQLSSELRKLGIQLIAQPAVKDLGLICDESYHPNAKGRIVRTRQLADFLLPM